MRAVIDMFLKMINAIPFIQPLIKVSDNGKKKIIGGEVLLRLSGKPSHTLERLLSSLDLSYNSITEQLLERVYVELSHINEDNRSRWNKAELFILCFNIHPSQVSDVGLNDLIKFYSPLYLNYGVKICLELIEWSPITLDSNFLLGLKALRCSGANIALDDYGCSYANLSILLSVCELVDMVKFNDVILNYAMTSSAAKEILFSITESLKSIGIETVIENIGTVMMESDAEKIGFDIYQGYLYCKPIECNLFIRRFLL